ncbi:MULTISPECIES: nucleoside triphosphate pyrophosphohydrolase [Anaerolinea]|uniref:nucleoside triphosphate pyrophosphohydrolase n=1 Tax=Anaerolinea TaxID=233189 RepID=UPI00263130B9|nr:nucleoside triphosphate pyrophosphohydrolase [Anaerolinea thermophila]
MNEQGITILGLGPGAPQLLTLEAWQHLQSIPEIYLRTRAHPVIAGFPSTLQVHSFDEIYDQNHDFSEVYRQIVERVLEHAQKMGAVTYAVPGHPFVAEATAPEIVRRAGEMGIPVRVIEGISFLEPVFSALQMDPFPRAVLVDALELGALHVPNFPPDSPALIAQIYSRQIASEVKLTLNAFYPDEFPVRLVHAAGTPQQKVEDLALYEIDRSPHIGLLTALYVPPLDEDTSMEAFLEIVAHLRAPDGCPWDREQTLQSLGPHLLEETYEALEALDQEQIDNLREELGDLLLLVSMLSQIASEEGFFTFPEVVQGIHRKIVRRHPHVFGNVDLKDARGVLRNWEKLKEAERKENGTAGQKGILDGVSKALPSLIRAQEYQSRAAHVGFDWSNIQGVREKVMEEWEELQQAGSPEEIEKEIGDLLFAVVNLSRWYKVDAETALRKASERFMARFKHIEQEARVMGKSLGDLSMDEMEALWQQAKRQGK